MFTKKMLILSIFFLIFTPAKAQLIYESTLVKVVDNQTVEVMVKTNQFGKSQYRPLTCKFLNFKGRGKQRQFSNNVSLVLNQGFRTIIRSSSPFEFCWCEFVLESGTTLQEELTGLKTPLNEFNGLIKYDHNYSIYGDDHSKE